MSKTVSTVILISLGLACIVVSCCVGYWLGASSIKQEQVLDECPKYAIIQTLQDEQYAKWLATEGKISKQNQLMMDITWTAFWVGHSDCSTCIANGNVPE